MQHEEVDVIGVGTRFPGIAFGEDGEGNITAVGIGGEIIGIQHPVGDRHIGPGGQVEDEVLQGIIHRSAGPGGNTDIERHVSRGIDERGGAAEREVIQQQGAVEVDIHFRSSRIGGIVDYLQAGTSLAGVTEEVERD